jgi:hypothetical protein
VTRLAAVALALVLAAGSAGAAERPAADAARRASTLHVLQRLTYGPRPGDVERVQGLGLAAWLDRQLDPARIDDSATERALAALSTLTMSIDDLHREYPRNNGGVGATPPFPPPVRAR